MDPIADMLSIIKNAGEAGRNSVAVPYSQVKMDIAETLQERGYIASAALAGTAPREKIELTLAWEDGRPKIRGIERISKGSRRVYEKAKNLRPVKNGYGDAVLSTPRGVMTGREARRANIGGEILFNVW